MTVWWQSNRTLVLLTITLVLARASLIFCTEEFWPSLERFYAGTVARDMAMGLKLPLLDYQFSSYEAGWVIAAAVCLPFMKVLGFTSLAMAVPGILIHVIPMVLFYLILSRFIDRRVALIFGLQYVVAPYAFNINSLFVGFNYFNLPFLTAVFLWLYLNTFRGQNVRSVIGGPWLSVFCLGLWGGFSTWTCFAFLLAAVPCLAHWLIYCRAAGLKPATVFTAGFVLGLSPLFFRMTTFAGGIKSGIVDRIVSQDFGGFVHRFADFVKTDPEFAWSVFFQYLEILGIVLFAVLIMLNRDYFRRAVTGLFGGQRPEEPDNGTRLIFAFYLLTFMAVYCLSDFSNERYFQLIYPFLFGCNAITIGGLMDLKARLWRRAGAAALALHLLLSIGDCAAGPLYQTTPNLSMFRDKAYSYELLGCLVSWRFHRDPDQVMRILNRMKTPEERHALIRGFGFELALSSGDGGLVADYIDRIMKTADNDMGLLKAFNTGLLLGYGQQHYSDTYLAEFYPGLLRTVDRDYVRRFVKVHAEYIRYEESARHPELYTGLGLQFFAVADSTGLTADEVEGDLDTRYLGDFRRGIKLGEKYTYHI